MKKAFTLVEVMIVAGIAGLIMVAGIAPLMYSVRLMSETRASFTEESRERTAINRMILDVRGATSASEPRPFRLLHRDALSGPEDYLILWTLMPSYSRLPLSAVIFGMPPESVLQGDYEKGLYRWFLSDDKRPEEVTMDDLVPERGRLVLAGVENVEFKVLRDRDWVDEYSGGIPQALRVVLKYGKEADGSGEERVRNYDVWLPRH